MPSDLVVMYTKPTEVKKHPNADKLDIITVSGWQTIVAKGFIKEDDNVIYIPPDSVITDDLANRMGVAKYLKSGNRVNRISLRGEPSFGIVHPAANLAELSGKEIAEGENVAELLKITKYEKPPNPLSHGGIIKAGKGFRGLIAKLILKAIRSTIRDVTFVKYTKIANLRYYFDVFRGINVVYTEKIHGTNSMTGLYKGEPIAASHNNLRTNPKSLNWFSMLLIRIGQKLFKMPHIIDDKSVYWQPYHNIQGLSQLLQHLYTKRGNPDSIQVFGEIYGPQVQPGFDYGMKGSEGYAAFDIMINGKYLDFHESITLFKAFGVPHVPILYEGIYDQEKVKELASGKTTLPADHIREGVVVRPLTESRSAHGRAILKFVSDEYLMEYEENDFSDV